MILEPEIVWLDDAAEALAADVRFDAINRPSDRANARRNLRTSEVLGIGIPSI